MIKVKICGITNLADAQASVAAGCDALGFVFYRKSPRYITPQKAGRIIRQLPARVIKIGIFVNAKEKEVRRIARLCRLEMLQFHGEESPGFCREFKNYKIIKAFRVKKRLALNDILKYKTFAYLFDAYAQIKRGGTGKSFDWRFIPVLSGLKQQVFLSGGLSEKNVKAAIKSVSPDWLDASSSLEASPGKKDHKKVKEFIRATRKKVH